MYLDPLWFMAGVSILAIIIVLLMSTPDKPSVPEEQIIEPVPEPLKPEPPKPEPPKPEPVPVSTEPVPESAPEPVDAITNFESEGGAIFSGGAIVEDPIKTETNS
jgi:hypothetical protein